MVVILALLLLVFTPSVFADNKISSLPGEGILLRQAATPTSVFIGEQVINSTEFYSTRFISEPQLGDLTAEGFVQEPFGMEEKFTEMLGNERVTVVRIKRALFPLRSGKLVLPPRTMKVLVLLDSSLAGLGTRVYTARSLESNEVQIKVSPLPSPPSDIPGWDMTAPLVGVTSLNAHIGGDAVIVGEAKSFEVTIVTNGNLSGWKEVPVKVSNEALVYFTKPTQRSFENLGFLFVERTFRLSIVPTKPGIVHVSPIVLAYFDPASKQYKTARTQEASFEATGVLVTRYEKADQRIVTNPEQTEYLSYFRIPLFRYSSKALAFFGTIAVIGSLFLWQLLSFALEINQERRSLIAIRSSNSPNELFFRLEQFLRNRYGLSVESDVRMEIGAYSIPEGYKLTTLVLLDRVRNLEFSLAQDEFQTMKTLAERVIRASRPFRRRTLRALDFLGSGMCTQ